jgi:hypothetical protein
MRGLRRRREREFLGGRGEVTMPGHEFMLKLNREVTDDEIELLYEAGCSDAAVETGPLGTMLDFTRQAPTLAVALLTAVNDVEKVPGLHAEGVVCGNMVTLAVIAERAHVTREAVRLWSTGQRGPGDFPPAMLVTPAGEKVWDWQQVAGWLIDNNKPEAELTAATSRSRTLWMADRVLAARAALRSEPDESIREGFEQLLQNA